MSKFHKWMISYSSCNRSDHSENNDYGNTHLLLSKFYLCVTWCTSGCGFNYLPSIKVWFISFSKLGSESKWPSKIDFSLDRNFSFTHFSIEEMEKYVFTLKETQCTSGCGFNYLPSIKVWFISFSKLESESKWPSKIDFFLEQKF